MSVKLVYGNVPVNDPVTDPVKEPVKEPVLICLDEDTVPTGRSVITCAELETIPDGMSESPLYETCPEDETVPVGSSAVTWVDDETMPPGKPVGTTFLAQLAVPNNDPVAASCAELESVSDPETTNRLVISTSLKLAVSV